MSEMGMVENGGQYSVMMFDDMSTFTFDVDHVNFAGLIESYNERDSERFKELSEVAKVINESLSDVDEVELVDGAVFVGGEPVDNRVCDKIIQFYEAGIDYSPLVKFLLRLQKNPSMRSVDQLFSFLEHENIAIASDGRFLAYKAVTADYLDKHSRSVDNSIGSVCSMPRNKVDDNPDSHCSHGYHVGSLQYSGPEGWFVGPGDRVLIVAIDPEHAVSVPSDHSCQKLRVCEYEVMGEYERPLNIVELDEEEDEDDYLEDECEDECQDESENGSEDVRTYSSIDPANLVPGNVIKFYCDGLKITGIVEEVDHVYLDVSVRGGGIFDFFEMEDCAILC